MNAYLFNIAGIDNFFFFVVNHCQLLLDSVKAHGAAVRLFFWRCEGERVEITSYCAESWYR